jgi:hypothetical protein
MWGKSSLALSYSVNKPALSHESYNLKTMCTYSHGLFFKVLVVVIVLVVIVAIVVVIVDLEICQLGNIFFHIFQIFSTIFILQLLESLAFTNTLLHLYEKVHLLYVELLGTYDGLHFGKCCGPNLSLK